MDTISPVHRIWYRYLGLGYWLTYTTSRRKFLWFRLSSYIKLASIIFLVMALLNRWGRPEQALALTVLLWIYFSYWRAKRAGYFRFVPGDQPSLFDDALATLPSYERVLVQATGVFSVKDWESSVLLRPAQYWQVPLGDQVIMVEHQTGSFLYQFFSADSVKDIAEGWLLFGRHPRPALAISFLTSWGPEFYEVKYSLLGRAKDPPPPTQRTIYLSFEDRHQEKVVHNHILRALARVGRD